MSVRSVLTAPFRFVAGLVAFGIVNAFPSLFTTDLDRAREQALYDGMTGKYGTTRVRKYTEMYGDGMKAYRDRRFKYIALACLMVVAFMAMCCAPSQVAAPNVQATRSIMQQYTSAVVMLVGCDDKPMRERGSGVIITPTRIATAAHVVLPSWMEDATTCKYAVRTYAGYTYNMRTVYIDRESDLATLRLENAGAFDSYTPISIGDKPALDAVVCSLGAMPWRSRFCGHVQITAGHPGAGDLEHDGLVQPGNSGGGVYDASGALVGVVTHASICITGIPMCGGGATSLASHKSWVQP